MNHRYKIGWKVCAREPDGRLYSATKHAYKIEYNTLFNGAWTNRPFQHNEAGALTVFNSKAAAEAFVDKMMAVPWVKQPNNKPVILRTRYRPSKDKHVHKGDDWIRLDELPMGTRLAEAVQIIG